jgi:outer membrane protein assembly factor BamB
MKKARFGLAVLAIGMLSCAHSPHSVRGEDWPQWGGPRRDLVWRESGIVESFASSELPRMWTTPIGEGYAGPALAGGRVFVMDFVRGEANSGKERVLCLDADTGEILWKHEYDVNYTIGYAYGPRTTPSIDEDKVYAIGAMGHLWCLDGASGGAIWQKNFVEDYGTKLPTWGMAGSPLVDGENLICLVGGKDALVVCFDKATGREKWRALDDPEVGYAPPVIFDIGGRRQLIVWHPHAVSAVDPATGEPLWSVPYAVRSGMTIVTPRQVENRLLVSSFYNGARMIEVGDGGTSASIVWRGRSASEIDTDGLHAIMCTPWIDDGHIYGVCSYGQFRCLNAATGERVWETLEPTGKDRWFNAFLIPHEDRYFIANEQGELIITRLSPEGYQEISRAKLLDPTRPVQRRQTVWSHPAFAMRSVFARNDKEIIRVDLSQ